MPLRHRFRAAGAAASAGPCVEPLELRRLLSASDLDPTFGDGGKAVLPYSGSMDDIATALAVLPDGRFVVGAESFPGGPAPASLARYLADGRLDPSFGTGGVARLPLPWHSGVQDLAPGEDGSLLAIGTPPAGTGAPHVQRFTSAGHPDPAWVGPGTAVGNGAARAIIRLGQDRSLLVTSDAVARLHADGTLDAGFAVGGVLRIPTDPGLYRPRLVPFAAAVQGDGAIVLAGERLLPDSAERRAAVRRYTADGTLDTSFGTGGTALLPASIYSSSLRDVALLPDGRIVVAGHSGDDSFAARLLSDGSLDATFGAGGAVTVPVTPTTKDAATSLAVRADGSILLAGTHVGDGTLPPGVFVARLLGHGAPDSSFRGDGVLEQPMPAPWLMYGRPILGVLDGGGILLASGGYPSLNTTADLTVARYDADGSIDPSFGPGGGFVATDFPGPLGVRPGRSALQPDGKLVFAGDVTTVVAGDLLLARLGRDGDPDAAFGTRGDAIAEHDFGFRGEFGRNVLAQPDGKLVVVGGIESRQWQAPGSQTTRDYLVARFHPDGTPDASFGDGGRVVTDLGGTFEIFGPAAIQPDGKILALGLHYAAATGRLPVLVRYLPDGRLDERFGAGGHQLLDLPGLTEEHPADVIVTADGRLLVAGSASGGGDYKHFLARLTGDGALDRSFGGGDGLALIDGRSYDDGVVGIVNAPSGQLYLAATGYTAGPESKSLALTSFTADGTPNASFGTAGTASLRLPTTRDTVARFVRSPEGKFLFAGTRTAVASGGGTQSDFLIVRMDADGRPDESFAAGGIRIIDLGTRSDTATDLHITPDGRIIVTGRSETADGGVGFAAVRLVGELPARPAVVARQVFYNNSRFDGFGAAVDARDDAAVASDKWALPDRTRASFGNYTSYSRGINGVMIDVAHLPAGPGPGEGDLLLRVGNVDDPASWAAAPRPSAVSVRRAAGANGSDRITLTWADGAIRNSWLQVTVPANAKTGLEKPDVFYFGNLAGETGDATAAATTAAVTARDVIRARAAASRARAGVTHAFDFNRDGRVNVLDQRIVRGNLGRNIRLLRTPYAGVWQTAAAMPVTLAEVAGGVIGNTLYLVGQGSGATVAYDLAAGIWSSATALARRPYPGNHHAAEVVNGKLYLFGGLGSSSPGKVQIYDPAANRWTLGADMPFAAGSSSSAVIEGIVYVAGGITGSSTTDRVGRYDPTRNEWSEVARMPQGRNHTASGTDGQKLYVFGGRGPGSGDANTVANGFDTVQVYDPATNTWVSSAAPGSTIRPLPQARGGMGKAVFHAGEFHVFGGETASGAGATPDGVYRRVDTYHPATNTWRLEAPMLTARHGIFPLRVENRIYVAAGGVRAGASSSNILEVLYLPLA